MKRDRSRAEWLRGEWRGLRGARLRAAAPRYLATLALGVLVALGLRSLVFPPNAPRPLRPAAGADAPSEGYALQLARAYLSYDPSRPGLRARALASLAPQGLEATDGALSASGPQRVLWADVASDQPALLGGRVITVAAGLSTQRLPVYLAIPVRHDVGHPLELAGCPAFVGAPAIDTAAGVSGGEAVDDPAVEEVARRVIRNYLTGSAANLRADLTANAAVTLPTLALSVRGVDQVSWIGGRGSDAVLVTVTAADPRGATYRLAYELGIAYRERPYVDFIEVVPTAS